MSKKSTCCRSRLSERSCCFWDDDVAAQLGDLKRWKAI